jgi:hypothetical protein
MIAAMLTGVARTKVVAAQAGLAGSSAVADVKPAARHLTAWSRLPECVIAVCLAAVYAPALLATYGLKDDYTYLASAHGYAFAGTGEPASSIRLGRPLFGLVVQGLYSAVPDVGGLWVARALSAIGMVVFAVVLYRALVTLVRTRTAATAITILICTLPPFLVYVGWATLFAAPYSAALGGAAAFASARASESTAGARVRWLILGVAVLVLALAIYQPTAMAFWLVALILALSRRHTLVAVDRLVRCVVIVGVPAMLGGYLILKVGVWTLGAASAQRSGLVSDIPAKLGWIPEPLGLALNLFHMPQSTAFGALVACLVVAGTVVFCRDCTGRARVVAIGLAAVTIPLSFAPNLLSQEDYATFRTVGPLTATFALLAALFFVAIERDGDRGIRKALSKWTLVAVAALSGILGFTHLRTLITVPLSREWRLVESEAARLPAHTVVVGVLAPTVNEGPIKASYGVRDEFGVPSSASTWSDASMVWLAARQAGRANGSHMRVLVSVGRDTKRVSGVAYIDMQHPQHLH